MEQKTLRVRVKKTKHDHTWYRVGEEHEVVNDLDLSDIYEPVNKKGYGIYKSDCEIIPDTPSEKIWQERYDSLAKEYKRSLKVR